MKFTAVLLSLLCVFTLVSCTGQTPNADEPSGDSSLPESASPASGTQSSVLADISPDSSPNSLDESITPEGEITVVVLGDSIARGYGLKDVDNERYSSLLAEKLKDYYANVEVYNYGIDGQTGAELAESLENNPPAELKDADYVIISIGGNNILGGLGEVLGSAITIDENAAQIFTDYFKYLFGTEGEDRSKYAYAAGELDKIFKAANAAFESEEFKALVDSGSEKLKNELPRIIQAVKKDAPNAKILVQTIYNPYKDIGISLRYVDTPLDLDSHGEASVSELNKVIESLSKELGYTVVPVHDAFDASDDKLTNAGIDLGSVGGGAEPLNFGVDPHPNAAGHRLIAGLCRELISENKNA